MTRSDDRAAVLRRSGAEVYDLTVCRDHGGYDRVVLLVDLGVTLQYACDPGCDHEVMIGERADQSPDFLRLVGLLMQAQFEQSMGVQEHEKEYEH
jgi:hypothetical protein